MKIVKKTETLQATARTGKAKFWLEQVVTDGKNYYVQSEYWQMDKNGKESKHTLSVPYIVKPTNVGRANERNAKEQAIFQIDSDFKKQIDKGYDLIGKKNTTRKVLPMLANKFTDKKHKVNYPVYGQFKYNGCLDYNTLLDLEDGTTVKLGDVVENKIFTKIKCYNEKTNTVEYKEVLGFSKKNENVQWYNIETESGKTILVTENHRIYLPKLKTWRMVKDLTINDELLLS